MSNDFWNEYESVDREESGGGGIMALVNITFGYKVYASGLEQEDSFFRASARKTDEAKAERKAQRALAETLAAPFIEALVEEGYEKQEARSRVGPKWAILLQVPAETAIRVIDGVWQNVTWKADRYFVADTWTSAAKEVVIPSLKDAGITEIPCTAYCRIGFKPDPYKEAQGEAGMTDKDQDGNPRFPQVAYITEAFDSLDAARAACGLETSDKQTDHSETAGIPYPEDWAPYPEAWIGEMAAIRVEYGIETKYTGPPPKVAAALAEVKAKLEANAEKLAANHSCTPADVLAWYDKV